MKKRFLPIGLIFLLTGFFLTSGNMHGQVCPGGMISYWKMQEQAGPVYLDSYGSNNGFAPTSSPLAAQGISGGAQQFSAVSSSYITISDEEIFDWQSNSSFSIELWVRFSGTSAQNQVFIGRDDVTNSMQWWIGATVTGKISWYLSASDGTNGLVTTNASFNNGAWHHVVAVRDGAASKNYLYVDGVLQNAGGTTVILTGNLSSSASISIGNLLFGGTPDYFYTGAIDEVAIYSRTLDLNTEIIPHYNNVRLYQIGYCDGDDPIIFSKPVIEAMVGQLYRYDVDASGNSVPTYSLIVGPEGMSMNTTTGELTWTPTSLSQNGHVIVRATNDKGFDEQEFNIFLAAAPSCRPNLAAYWDFNSASVPPFYDNVANYPLTGTGVLSVQGLSGKGLLFDGINDSLNMKDIYETGEVFFDFDQMPNFTIEVWAKSTASKEKAMVLVGRDEPANNTQYWLGINPDGSAGFFLSDWQDTAVQGYLTGGSNLLNGGWHHLVGSYDRSSDDMKLYVDGNMVGSVSRNFYNFGGGANLTIGMLNTAPDRYWFEGVMDELAFYNIQLSDARVLENYNAGMAGIGACVYNHAPGILSIPDSVVEQGSEYSYQFIASDIDINDALNISGVIIPEWITFSYIPNDSVALLTGTPGNDDVGEHIVLLRVSDGTIQVDQQFTLEVVNVNDSPEITSTPDLEVDQGTEYTYTVTAEDPDGDVLIYSAPQKPASFSFDTATKTLSGIPTNDDVGLVDITISVSDGTETVDQQFQITVNNINDPPEITSTPLAEIFQDEEYTYTLVATDPDGDTLTYSAPQIPQWMTFDPNTQKLSGTAGEFQGIVDITLRVTDGEFEVDQAYQLTVKNVNDLPVITTEPPTEVNMNDAYLYQIIATDEDGDDLTFTAASIPEWLTFTPSTTSAILSGTPGVANVGSHAIILKVFDGTDEVIQAFSIKVIDPTGVDLESSLLDAVYPIPAEDHIHFAFSQVGDYTIVLYDITGKVLKEVKEKQTGLISISLSNISMDLLFYKVTNGDMEYSVGKIVKE